VRRRPHTARCLGSVRDRLDSGRVELLSRPSPFTAKKATVLESRSALLARTYEQGVGLPGQGKAELPSTYVHGGAVTVLMKARFALGGSDSRRAYNLQRH